MTRKNFWPNRTAASSAAPRAHLRKKETAMDAREISRPATIDFDRFRLRKFIEDLKQSEELDIHEEQVDLVAVAAILHGNKKAVWFKKVGPEGSELVGNVAASRTRLARAFGVAPEDLSKELLRRLQNPPQIVEVARGEAPVQEVVLQGADLDVTKLPVHLQHAADGAPFISASIDYCIDPKTGWTNSGLRRLMLRGKTETGIDLNAPSDLRAIYMAASARGEKLPIAFVLGAHPIDMVSATMRVGVDELGLVSSLRGAPLPVVKCLTSDVRVPADAEWIIEGFIDERGYVEEEGPYGEYLGYYGVVKRNPVFHVTAITRRRDALFQTATISGKHMENTDTSNLEALRTEFNVWQALRAVVREPVAVYAPISAAGALNVRVAMRQRFPGEARTALYAVLGSVGVKNMFVVDPDIDIFSDGQMEWALGTRFQADKDLIVVTGVRMSPLDPSLHGSPTGAKCGYDLTWPMAHANRWELAIPEPPSYQGKRYPTLRAALGDGPKRFEELIAALGSTDGREIVRELDTLRAQGLKRDDQGRYSLAAT
jgi:2,5-furandicarboxylate decarboxylase 1